MFIRNPFNYDMDIASFKTGLDCSSDPTRAQQHMRDETDINIMVERFARTGMPPAPPVSPDPVDFDQVFDFQSAMNVVVEGRQAFMELPAKVRARFQNDPGQFLAFIHDDSNMLEAQALGLVPRPAVEPVKDSVNVEESGNTE